MVSKPERSQYGSCHGSRGGCKSLNAEGPIRMQNSSCGVCDEPSGTGTGLSLSSSVSPCHYHSANAPDSFFYHPWCIITANEGVVKKTPEIPYESASLKKTPKSYIRLPGQVNM